MEMPNTNHQIMASQQLEEVPACLKTQQQQQELEKKQRPTPEQALKCPRCASTNTKFCYYNNYSLSQPRYFCKGCRRYWTQGGSLRNVPVGGGCRKNKRANNPFAAKRTTTPIHHHHHNLMPSNAYPLLPNLVAPSFPLGFSALHNQPNNNLVFRHVERINDGLFDVLRNGFIDHNNGQLYNNSSFGVGGNLEVSSGVTRQEAVNISCEMTNHGGSSMVRGYDHQWQLGGDGNAREYWPGCSSWQGITNSSLM